MIKENLFKKAAFMKNKTLFLSMMFVLVAVGVWIAIAAELTAVTINHPTNDENISGSYTFSAATTGDADNVTFYYCNATNCYSTCVNDTAGTAFNCTFDTSGISDGTYDINATAINSTGAEINATAITSVTFDNTGPTVTITNPANQDYVNAFSQINGVVTDALTTVNTVFLYIYNGSHYYNETASEFNASNVEWLTATLSGSDWNYTSPSWVEGVTYNVTVKANDSLGTNGSEVGRQFTYDNTAPTVPVSSSAGTSTTASSTTISGTVTDSGSGIHYVIVDGTNQTAGAYSKLVNLVIGDNTFTVTAYDNASNSGSTSITVTRTAVVTSISSGGGTVSYTSVSEQGTSITLRKGYIKTLTVNKSYHTMKCIELGTDYITFQITSTPVTITLKLLESKSFDFDNDGYYDLYVKLDEIKSSTAYMTLKQIHEPVTAEAEEQPEEQPEETPEEAPEEVPEETPEEAPPEEKVPPEEEVPPAKLTWLWILVVLIIIGLVAYLFIYKKKKEY